MRLLSISVPFILQPRHSRLPTSNVCKYCTQVKNILCKFQCWNTAAFIFIKKSLTSQGRVLSLSIERRKKFFRCDEWQSNKRLASIVGGHTKRVNLPIYSRNKCVEARLSFYIPIDENKPQHWNHLEHLISFRQHHFKNIPVCCPSERELKVLEGKT